MASTSSGVINVRWKEDPGPDSAAAIQAIVALAHNAAEPKILTDPQMQGKVLVYRGNACEIMDRPPQQDHGDLHTLESVIAYAQRNPNGEIRLHREGLRALLDRADRWQGSDLELAFSSRFSALANLAARPAQFQPKDAVRWLRTQLEYEGPIVSRLRKVAFKRASDGSVSTEHGKESWGSRVEAEVQGADSIPESFVVELPVFTTPGFQYTVSVAVLVHIDLDPACPHIALIPSADGITAAVHTAISLAIVDLRKALGEDYPIYYGSV